MELKSRTHPVQFIKDKTGTHFMHQAHGKGLYQHHVIDKAISEYWMHSESMTCVVYFLLALLPQRLFAHSYS